MELKLRNYQEEAVEAFFSNLEYYYRQLFSLPTGSGKTVVGSSIAKRFHLELNSSDDPILFIAHRDELLSQTEQKIRLVWSDAKIGFVKAERNEQDAQVILASTPTLVRGRKIRRPKLVIYDEAHHILASGSGSLLERIGVFGKNPVPLLGLTATPMRSDGKSLLDVFEGVTYEKNIIELIQSGYLSDVRTRQIMVQGLDLSKIKSSKGDFEQKSLGLAMDQDFVIDAVVDAISQHAQNRKTVVFAVNVEQTYRLANVLTEHGYSAIGIDGSLKPQERASRLDLFREGEVRILVNCMLLTEGYDQPDIDCIVIARPTKSLGLLYQMVGRGTRKHPGKRDLLVLDIVGATNDRDLLTTKSLFDASDEEHGMNDMESVSEFFDRKDKLNSQQDLNETRNGYAEVGAVQSERYVWSFLGDGWYGIDCGRTEDKKPIYCYLMKSHTDEELYWPILYYNYEVWNLFDRPIQLEYAQGVAEQELERFEYISSINQKSARWRNNPATPNQKRHADKIGVHYDGEETAGSLSDKIGRFHMRRPILWINKHYSTMFPQ